MAAPSYTYTLTNSTTADASQVMQNYNDILNGVTDGTKDLSISAITCAGTATFNGAVNLGNGSADDLTFTGSIASNVPIKTNATYSIGSADIGLQYCYFGVSSTITTRVAAGAPAADINVVLPSRAGTLEVVPSIASSKTTTYPITATDDFIPINASASSFTVTLPTAVGASGKMYTLKSTHAQAAFVITVATTSSQTIDGATTTTINTQYEVLTVISDGANWHIVSRKTDFDLGDETWTDNQANATTALRVFREGAYVSVRGEMSFTGAASGAFTVTIPAAYTVDAMYDNTNDQVGWGECYDAGGWTSTVYLTVTTGTTLSMFLPTATGTYVTISNLSATVPMTWANTDVLQFSARWRVSGWKS